jgi:hypothetical protein
LRARVRGLGEGVMARFGVRARIRVRVRFSRVRAKFKVEDGG